MNRSTLIPRIPHGLWVLSLLGAILFVCLHALARMSVVALDDTFIYFNYAKHVAAGNGIVFGPRGIPSEGVTSLLFLYLLVPWEAAKANPMTGAVLYNGLACLITALMLGRAAKDEGILNRWLAPVAPLLFLIACCYDKSIRLVTFRGLETMLGPMGIAVSCAFAALALRKQEHFEKACCGFMVAAFVTYLIRPEYIVYLGAVGLVLLFRPSRIRALGAPLTILFALLGVLFIWKWQTFNALMPTAYYRKVAGADRNGPAYLLEWLQAYWPLLTATAAILLAERRLLKSHFVQGLLIASFVNVLMVMKMLVLVGYGFRFLILPITSCYLLLALGLCSLIQRLPSIRPFVAVGIAATGFVAANVVKPLPLGYPQAWNLASRADQAFEENLYVQLAEHLKQAIPEPKTFTLSFGDAGTLPYVLGCRYLDPNGLSEPDISRLFQEQDSPEKAATFTELIFSEQPDMVILPLGSTQNDAGCFVPAPNAHDPFTGTIPGEYWQRLLDDDYVYICAINLYYPIYVTLRKDSELYPVLTGALRSFPLSDFSRNEFCVYTDGTTFEFPVAPRPGGSPDF